MGDTGPLVLMLIAATVATRWATSLYPYSGAGKPPMFGDFEAQRHWMEITYQLPVKEWYHNTSNNDLQYWGLDYPPLTAYHSWLCGYVANKINPDWVSLHSSQGHESPQHKLFMRYTVLVADLLVYIPAVIAFYMWTLNDRSRSSSQLLASAAVTLLYPGIILIDYGHFQYNCISLGFTLWAVVAIATQHDLLGSIAFVFALNYKQMELYHSFPFFCFLLGRCLWSRDEIRIWKLVKIGVTVIAAFCLCWYPFLSDVDQILQVIHRIFPFARGLFEDKVSNVWCSLNVLIKLRQYLSQDALIKLSLASTLLGLLPSGLDLLLRPSIQKFKYSLVNCSLVFFLFSYQVHEKSILIAALPVCLLLHEQPFICTWFLLISVFSMLPLLIKDGLILATIALTALFFVVSMVSQSSWVNNSSQPIRRQRPIQNLAFYASVLGAIILTACSLFVQTPPRYPDLWPVLVSVYSCAHFALFLIVFLYLQYQSEYEVQTSAGPVHSSQGVGKTSKEQLGGSRAAKRGGKRKQKTNKID